MKAKLGHLNETTHLVFGAYVEKPTAAEKTEVNVRLLKTLLDVLETSAPKLRHITLYQGGKAYGACVERDHQKGEPPTNPLQTDRFLGVR